MSYRHEVRLLIILSFVLSLSIAGQWWLKNDARRATLSWRPALVAGTVDAAATAPLFTETGAPAPETTPPEPALPEPSPETGSLSPNLLDVNAATIEQLQTLPGVGPVIAEIIKERIRLGGFKTVDDLLGVKGIGPVRLARIKPLVMVTPPKKEGSGD